MTGAEKSGEFQPLTGGTQEGCCGRLFGGLRPCLAEFVGVALFVFVGCLSVQDQTPVAVAFCHGLAISVLISCIGHISGGHLNPAVTLGVAISGSIHWLKATLYIVSQLLGGVVGALCVRLCLDLGRLEEETIYTTINGGAHAVNANVSVGSAIVCEILITAILVMTVLLTAVNEESKTQMAPLYIGSAVTVGILAAAQTSGGSMNPARSLGPAVVMGNAAVWSDHYVYWVGPALGAILSGLLYRFGLRTNEGGQQ